VKLSKNPVFHDRLKHIEMRYHYLRDMVQKGAIRLQYIPTEEQIADVFTMPLIAVKFVYFETSLAWQRMPPSLIGILPAMDNGRLQDPYLG